MFFLLKFIILSSLFTTVIYGRYMYKINVEFKRWIQNFSCKYHLILVISVIVISVYNFFLGMIMLLFMFASVVAYKQHVIKHNMRLIEFYGYKIFKFILNQISSGILISDAIKSMYRIVDDNRLRDCLIEVSAYYAKTTDLTESLNILRKQFTGIEVDTLCMAIEQGIHTGTNYETLEKVEQLLFKRYINQIKLDTKWRKKRSILAVLLLCSIMVLMIAIPVLMDIIEAFNQIFLG